MTRLGRMKGYVPPKERAEKTITLPSIFMEAWGLMLAIGILHHHRILPGTIGYGVSLLVLFLTPARKPIEVKYR